MTYTDNTLTEVTVVFSGIKKDRKSRVTAVLSGLKKDRKPKYL